MSGTEQAHPSLLGSARSDWQLRVLTHTLSAGRGRHEEFEVGGPERASRCTRCQQPEKQTDNDELDFTKQRDCFSLFIYLARLDCILLGQSV